MSKSLDERPTRAEQDQAEATQVYRLAAEQGIAGAQSRLGVMYAEGRGGWHRTTGNRCDGFGWRLSRAMRRRRPASDWPAALGAVSLQDFVARICG